MKYYYIHSSDSSLLQLNSFTITQTSFSFPTFTDMPAIGSFMILDEEGFIYEALGTNVGGDQNGSYVTGLIISKKKAPKIQEALDAIKKHESTHSVDSPKKLPPIADQGRSAKINSVDNIL